MKLQLTIMTKEDVEKRYGPLKGARVAKFTDEAVAAGYTIGILHYIGLKQDTATQWLRNAESAVAAHFESQRYKIGVFTDLTEVLTKDKLYFSFKTKEGVQIAHSFSGCDEEGFIYNC